MIGIIVELLISWILLWLFNKSNLGALGIKPTRSRLKNFFIGLLLASCTCFAYNLLTTAFIENDWVSRLDRIIPRFIFSRLWFVLKSVLFEELLFRGALLYIAIKLLGNAKACILSAICFGVYHWFTYSGFDNPAGLIIIFLLTGIAGLTFAYSFAKTKSIYLPIGLHLGWNIVNMIVFANGPLGLGILIRVNNNQLQGIESLLVFLFQMLALPVLTFWYLKKSTQKKSLAYN